MGVRWMAYLCCTLAMIGVGSTVVASKLIAAGLPPFTATALRFAIALPIFIAIMRLRGERWPRPSRRDAALLVLQAGSGSVGYTVFLLSGMRLTSATDAGVIAGTLPAVAALVAVFALRERPSPVTLAALALATSGVLVCTSGGSPAHAAPPAALGAAPRVFGNLLVVAAVFCEGFFILLNKRLSTPLSALQMSTSMTGIGLVLALVPAFFERPWALHADAAALAGVVYYALVPTVAGFLLWFAGASRIAGAQASAFTAFVPVSAAALAALVLRETMTPAQWWGMGCVVGAVLLMAGEGVRTGMRRGVPAQ
ncbi:DMT family transporter [Trinickia caryophylli]|uniref:Permease of the drug/metabolite transporter (DMT) superfamily n=1 Tax=Trinickia caryophylli TaxID=28094 RepID=A0A1X7FN43_TRICW|nr:DMT family transporter [Trinickia caryophylli]PMS13861.1 EamA/RhaT family transporter [Trinickia caryophylli]TRX14356.1 DMT family transporter [Trinickia caryophylli]WQE14191.1 DMT family transporter [Trinickia caryophylli]SMF55371.1 Permease of the drug/metabolite transporter (DMT) superfamily [Trinickia caryophylli]GLU33305.1 membrane protein [Trinickia caryophylli]